MAKLSQFGAGGWSPDQLPDLSGKVYLITGGNSGIGLEASRMLGAKGARVAILCRNPEKASAALADLKKRAPTGEFETIALDLSSLSSVRAAAAEARKRFKKIDALVCNAGIMMTPKRTLTADGFETQLGVNHLGHFALAAELCDLVEAASGRFVSTASLMHKYAPRLELDDPSFERGYTATGAYANSKLANLSFGLELDRRLKKAGRRARAYVCHPGYSATNLQHTGPSKIVAAVMAPLTALMSQPAAKGAVPTVLCAAGAEAEPGVYYGPTGFQEMTGAVDRASVAAAARDETAAAGLWALSEKLTSSRWAILPNGAL